MHLIMPRQLALIVNAHSRRIRKDSSFQARLQKHFHGRGPFFALKSPDELAPTLSEIRKVRPDILFICGGDGTLRQTIHELIKQYRTDPFPRIAILKTGTMNTVATGLGVNRSAHNQLKWILTRLDRSLPLPIRTIHPLRIDDTHGFIFAIGGFTNFIAQYSATSDPSPLRALWMLGRATISGLCKSSYAASLFPSFLANVSRGDRMVLSQAGVTTISASAIRHIGFGFHPYAQAEGSAGDFGALILRESPTSLLSSAGKIYRGAPIRSASILQFSAPELLIELHSELVPMVDGDLLKPRKEFALSRGPAVHFISG